MSDAKGLPIPVEAIKEAASHMLGYAARGVQIKMYADSARAYKYASDIQRWMENLQPAASETEKVECPNCGHGDDWWHGLGYNGACMRREKPAPPEPAAPEMPLPLQIAMDALAGAASFARLEAQSDANYVVARTALESWWRTHAQPVKAPRPKLEKTRRALKCGQERLNIVFLSEETTTRWNNLFYEALAELDEWEGR